MTRVAKAADPEKLVAKSRRYSMATVVKNGDGYELWVGV